MKRAIKCVGWMIFLGVLIISESRPFETKWMELLNHVLDILLLLCFGGWMYFFYKQTKNW